MPPARDHLPPADGDGDESRFARYDEDDWTPGRPPTRGGKRGGHGGRTRFVRDAVHHANRVARTRRSA